jgi:transposase
VKWAEERLRHNSVYWGKRVFGDAHWWHIPRSAAELAAARGAAKGPVHRKPKEKDDPRFHGGKKGVFKQGRRVGLFGVLTGGVLRTVWYEGPSESAEDFVRAVEKAQAKFLQTGKKELYLDGMGSYHGAEAAAALKGAGFRKVEKVPPNSPDLNPIENAWARLDDRMAATDPEELETNQEFKARAENALRWLNRNEAEGLTNMVESTQRRLGAVIKLNGGPDELLSRAEEGGRPRRRDFSGGDEQSARALREEEPKDREPTRPGGDQPPNQGQKQAFVIMFERGSVPVVGGWSRRFKRGPPKIIQES